MNQNFKELLSSVLDSSVTLRICLIMLLRPSHHSERFRSTSFWVLIMLPPYKPAACIHTYSRVNLISYQSIEFYLWTRWDKQKCESNAFAEATQTDPMTCIG